MNTIPRRVVTGLRDSRSIIEKDEIVTMYPSTLLAGEIYLILDETETLLRAGDIVIQRGTNHAWSNRSAIPCIQLAVLIGAERIKEEV